MKKEILKKILKVFLTLQWAKELPRQGFIALGFKRNEADSVAAHSWTTAILTYFLASEMNKNLPAGRRVNVDKAIKMALFHDMAETIVGDVGTFVKGMAKGAFVKVEEEGLRWLVRDLPTEKEITSLVKEYSQRKSLEARLVKVADNLDALAQAKGVPAAQSALKYFKEIYHITKIPFHKTAVEMILKDEVEPERSWQKKCYTKKHG
jgi:putative hydrolase of HD superfamily